MHTKFDAYCVVINKYNIFLRITFATANQFKWEDTDAFSHLRVTCVRSAIEITECVCLVYAPHSWINISNKKKQPFEINPYIVNAGILRNIVLNKRYIMSLCVDKMNDNKSIVTKISLGLNNITHAGHRILAKVFLGYEINIHEIFFLYFICAYEYSWYEMYTIWNRMASAREFAVVYWIFVIILFDENYFMI